MRLYESHPITITGKYAVACDEAPSFGTGLGNENTVEWVLVQSRQGSTAAAWSDVTGNSLKPASRKAGQEIP